MEKKEREKEEREKEEREKEEREKEESKKKKSKKKEKLRDKGEIGKSLDNKFQKKFCGEAFFGMSSILTKIDECQKGRKDKIKYS